MSNPETPETLPSEELRRLWIFLGGCTAAGEIDYEFQVQIYTEAAINHYDNRQEGGQ